ncbi:MAG: hypothetical protein ACLGIS_05015 [Actinomycetes bacterium]
MVTSPPRNARRSTRRNARRATRLAAVAGALALVAAANPAVALPAWRTTATSQTSAHPVRVLDLRHATHPRFDRGNLDECHGDAP